MGILSRASYVVRSKLNALVSSQEDPSETLDYSYERMRDELQDVKQGIADLTTQKKRLEIQKRRLEENVEKHNGQAREAVQAGRDDLARQALQKKKEKMTQIEDLETQIADLQGTQDRLVEKKEELKDRIERFRTEKETMKARYEAAEASARVSEAMSGVGDEMDETARAIERSRERTEEMEARAEAMDELQDSGAFDDALSDEDDIDRELREMRSSSEVEAELETLKTEAGRGSTEAVETDEATEDEPTGDEVAAELEELTEDTDAETESEDESN